MVFYKGSPADTFFYRITQNTQGNRLIMDQTTLKHYQMQRNRHPRPSLLNLPEEIIVLLLSGLPILDLVNLRAVNVYFRNLIDSKSCIWASASLENSWPSAGNILLIEKAASFGNVEALIKLGIAYVYNEGLPGRLEDKMASNGEKAAAMFAKAESLTPHVPPFTWLFFRPPWSTRGDCCKTRVFKTIYEMAKSSQVAGNKPLMACIAKVLSMFDDEAKREEALHWFNLAARKGCEQAAFVVWEHKYIYMHTEKRDCKASELKMIRELRDLTHNYLDAQLALCMAYAQGKYGGIPPCQAASYIKKFIKLSLPGYCLEIFRRHKELSPNMRYILLDWLAEVIGMKDFSTLTFHVTVRLIDRYLRKSKVTRANLQLIGITALVITSRYLGQEILTVREAAWLTDNTYTYEEVVRMMGQIIAAVKGQIRTITILDYLIIFIEVSHVDHKTSYLAQYLSELCLLHSDLGIYPQAVLGAGALFLACMINKQELQLFGRLQEFTGFTLNDLTKCIMHMHHRFFLGDVVIDHRLEKLVAVKQRYADERFCQVSLVEVPKFEELLNVLNVPIASWQYMIFKNNLHCCHFHLCSNSEYDSQSVDPFIKLNCLEEHDRGISGLNISTTSSGYDGDEEDENDWSDKDEMDISYSDGAATPPNTFSMDKSPPMLSIPLPLLYDDCINLTLDEKLVDFSLPSGINGLETRKNESWNMQYPRCHQKVLKQIQNSQTVDSSKQSVKRKRSDHLGNENKIQIISL